MENGTKKFDVMVAGAGMGGITAATILAKKGYSVLLLEASHVAGGCSSSYYRKGFIFESGATTLIGFDENQPLRELEKLVDVNIPKQLITPPMVVHLNGKKIVRWQDKKQWIQEVVHHFGEEVEQTEFWNLIFRISDVVWKAALNNKTFPPNRMVEWLDLLRNDFRDIWILPHAFSSVKQTAIGIGISNPDFFSFMDEQLMITAQATTDETPFLFGAPALSYTNSKNYYVPGGLIEMVNTLINRFTEFGGNFRKKEAVQVIEKNDDEYRITTGKNNTYIAETVVSNLPVWNMADITQGRIAEYFSEESKKFNKAWGAFTMGIVTEDVYFNEMPLHHQIHFTTKEKIQGLDSDSIFVSFSKKDDSLRAKKGYRVINVSTHTFPEPWFDPALDYNKTKKAVQQKIVEILEDKLPGFSQAEIKLLFSSTPVSWSQWVYRKKGRVGGIPQQMCRSLVDWTPSRTPFDGLFLCGDTVFPGQGIPGVTLSGINVSYRVDKYLKNLRQN